MNETVARKERTATVHGPRDSMWLGESHKQAKKHLKLSFNPRKYLPLRSFGHSQWYVHLSTGFTVQPRTPSTWLPPVFLSSSVRKHE